MDALEIELPRERTCGARARRVVEAQCQDGLDSLTQLDLKLVVTELVDNAFVHGEGRIGMKLAEEEDALRVEVTDEGHDASVRIREVAAIGGGHGLRLVDELALRWGAFEGSTHVWADLAIPAEPARAA